MEELHDIHGQRINEGDAVVVKDVYNPFQPPMIARNASLCELREFAKVVYKPTGKPAYSFERI